ncbi:MAG TPA: hypothetical protein EYM74_03150, partial [Candidatus Marinimicrobia bacterium]|nr:hypothetical protein [Candidatus Neomarinimicrobiota bacterium]
VDGSATGTEDGSSTYPYHTIQDAIAAETTTDGKRLLVLAGTYTYDSGSGAGTTYSFNYTDSYGNQSGRFIVSNGSPSSLNFAHSEEFLYPGSNWSIADASYFTDLGSFRVEASDLSTGTNFMIETSFSSFFVYVSNQFQYTDGWNVNVQQTSFAANAVIDLQGKNITLEAVSGPDSTFIDGEGQNSALSLDAESDDYDGYASSTEFIGFTFKDGPDDEPLINIVGPGISSSLDWAPTFTNCRFIDSEVSADDNDVAPVIIKNAEPTFDGCEFRDLHVEPNSFYNSSDIYGPIRLYGTQTTSYDTTAFRPQFKNCVIVGNSLKRGDYNGATIRLKGGAVAVGFGAIPYFENTRIDSNTVDIESGRYGDTDAGIGGGIFISNYLSRGAYIRFVNCSISGNSVKADEILGGGIYAAYPAVSLVNTIMVNNELDGEYADDSDLADARGAAIYYYTSISGYGQNSNPDEDPELRIVNSTIADNTISNIATGFAENGVGGAGINRFDHANHAVTIFNSIIYNNEIDGYLESENHRINLAKSQDAFGDDDALIDYSIIEFFSETGLDEDDLIDTDPGFVGSGDYSLSDASAAIGAGTDEYENIDAPAFDYNNEARPGSGGGNPDLGAFEHDYSTTPYPSKPQNLTVDTEGDSTVTISWTANTEDDLSKYRIYYGTSAAATLLDSVSGTPSYTATGLDNYTTYYFAVSAVDLDGYESAKSNEVSGEPKWFGPSWYVDTDNGTSSGDGSPAAPFREIQDAIDHVDPLSRADGLKDTILVLPGTYDRNDDQELYFKYTSGTYDGQPKNLVLKSRDGAATTILDGENKRVFEIVDGTDTTLQIIGFTITASGTNNNPRGGANDGEGSVIKVHGQSYWQGNQEIITYSGATFKNCLINDVDGEDSAVEVYYGNAVFIDCELSNNTADYSSSDGLGTAVRVGNEWSEGGSTVHFYRCKLVNNTITTLSANNIYGGAIGINGSNDNNVKLVNSVVAGNLVSYNNTDTGLPPPSGGGIYLNGGALLLINCTLVDNQISTYTDNLSDGGSAIRAIQNWNNFDSEPPQLTIFNSIVYDNFITTSAATNPNTSFTGQISIDDMNGDVDVYASYSLFGGDDDLGGDEILLNIVPDFTDLTYVLHERSPAIGAGEIEGEDVDGDEIYPPVDDILGNVRPNPADSNPDLGAYEHELAVTPYPSVVEDLTATPLHRSVQLEWDYHEEEDVISYIAYMGEDSIAFTAMDTVEGRFNTRTTIDSLDNGTDYWFYVTAVDTADYESSPTFHAKTSPFFQGPVWIVDADNGTSSGEGSPEEPMKYIRDAIEESADGDTVMLMPGTYDHTKNRNLDFQYQNDIMQNGVKNLTLMGKYGADTTIIDVDGNDFIDFQNGEQEARIEGLTISNSGSGAIRIWYSSVEIKNCVFENNSDNSFNGGGAIYLEGTNQPITVSNTLFKGNFASERGGAIYLGVDGSELLVANCIFDGNTANNAGGAINQDNNTNLLIVNSLFLDNQCQTSDAGGINTWAYMYGGNTEIINSIFINNTNNSGSDADISSNSVYTDHCILQSTSSPAYNTGDNYVFNPDSILTADTSDYSLDEYSPAIGLGLDEFYSSALEEDVILSEKLTTDYLGNARVQPADSHIDLGPIEHERWEPRRNVYYVDTGGDDSNDGLSAGTPLLTLGAAFNKSVVRDTIELASGTYAGTGNSDLNFNGVDRIIRSTDGAETTIIDCENMGQAFILENGETDSTIISGITIQNGTVVNGGAVYIDGADPIFEGVIFKDNSATISGGAVYASDSHSEFVNCVFVGNHAAESGALAFSGGDVSIDFITAVGNHGDDDISFSGAVSISNSILWGNSPVDDDADVTYSNVMGGNAGTGNYNGRPGFVDGLNGDFQLQDWSPVIGQASAANAVLYDLEGNARSDSIPDMGAYENALDIAAAYTRQSWYVSTSGSDSVFANMGTVDYPFETIQHALNHAIYDDEVHVAPGDYSES